MKMDVFPSLTEGVFLKFFFTFSVGMVFVVCKNVIVKMNYSNSIPIYVG